MRGRFLVDAELVIVVVSGHLLEGVQLFPGSAQRALGCLQVVCGKQLPGPGQSHRKPGQERSPVQVQTLRSDLAITNVVGLANQHGSLSLYPSMMALYSGAGNRTS